MNFTGKLARGGRVVIPFVEGDYQVQPPGQAGLGSWDGMFDLPEGYGISPGDFELILDDGRSGQIVITRIHAGSHSPTEVSFSGNGPPP